MPTITPSGFTGVSHPETLSDALFAPMGVLRRVRYQAGLEIVPHNHSGTGQFLVVLAGETLFEECGASRFRCPPGTAIIVPPHCQHWWRMEQETTLLQIDHRPFSQDEFGHLALLFGSFQKHLVTIDVGPAEMERVMARIDTIMAEDTAVKDALLSTVMLEFLARLVERSRVLSGELGYGMHPAVVRAIAYIDRHIRQPIALDDLATHARLGTSRLCQLFREQVGRPPGEYVADKRAQMAERLLLNPMMTVSEVANYLGFSSVNYFSRFFKKHCGISPSGARHSAPKARTR